MIMVDEVVNDGKFGYKNRHGIIEFVEVLCGASIGIVDFYVDGVIAPIYTEDIPKLIEALQAAEEYAEIVAGSSFTNTEET